MAHAEVILTKNLPPLGAEADRVKVRRGYARNFLLPRGNAVEANSASARLLSHLKAKRAEREARELTEAEELSRRIGRMHLTFELETGETGKAFGAITAKDITDRLSNELKGVAIPRHAVALEHPIKAGGDHEVPVKLHPEVTATLHVSIKAPAPKEPPAEEAAPSPPKTRRGGPSAKSTRKSATE